MSQLRRKTFQGILWSGLGQFVNQFLRIALTIILVRLIAPDEFGLMGMVMVFVGFANVLVNFGFGASIIQIKDINETELNTIFWTNLLFGGFIAFLLVVFSGVIASFYEEDRLRNLSIFISLTFVFSSLSLVQDALFRKDLNFKALEIRRMIALIVSGVIAIVMGVLGYGVWSLAVSHVVNYLIAAVLIWYISSWRPKFIYKISSLKRIFKFSFAIFTNSSINYFASNLDNLLIGKYIGSTGLGYYSKSFSIISLPVSNISRVLSRVMFPSFSKIQEQKEKIQENYLNTTRLVILFSSPLMILILLYATSFVNVFFGIKWIEIIPIVKIFCISAICMSINVLLGTIVTSQGRSDLIINDALYKKSLLIIGIIVGLNWGLIGVATGKMIADIISVLITFYHTKRAINLSIYKQVLNVVDLIFLSLISGYASFYLVIGLQIESHILNFILGMFVGFLVYGLLLLIFLKKDLMFFKNKIMRLRKT